MDIENELIKTIAKYRGREVATFETRIDLLAQDCLDEIRRLKKQISEAALTETGDAKTVRLIRKWCALKLAEDPVTFMLYKSAQDDVALILDGKWEGLEAFEQKEEEDDGR